MPTAIENLRSFRERTDLTQEELAHLLDTSWVSVSRWERGVAEPKPRTLERIERLQRLVERIGQALSPGALPDFLETPQPGLRNHRPKELLDNEYAFEDLIALVDGLKSGDMA